MYFKKLYYISKHLFFIFRDFISQKIKKRFSIKHDYNFDVLNCVNSSINSLRATFRKLCLHAYVIVDYRAQTSLCTV